MESFIFLYIWNQKCSIQYPVLHNYYTAWLFFSPKSGKIIYLCENFSFWCLKQLKINITGQIMVSQWHYSLHAKYIFSSNAIYRYISRRGAFQIYLFIFVNISDLNFRTNKLTLFRYVTGRYIRSSVIEKSLLMESS
jgi:hypothetical protein